MFFIKREMFVVFSGVDKFLILRGEQMQWRLRNKLRTAKKKVNW